MGNATNRWISRKAIGLLTLLVLSPAMAAALQPPPVSGSRDLDPASLAVVGASLLGLGMYRRKHP